MPPIFYLAKYCPSFWRKWYNFKLEPPPQEVVKDNRFHIQPSNKIKVSTIFRETKCMWSLYPDGNSTQATEWEPRTKQHNEKMKKAVKFIMILIFKQFTNKIKLSKQICQMTISTFNLFKKMAREAQTISRVFNTVDPILRKRNKKKNK